MKRILKAIFASVLAMALTLPALSGCGSNSPKDELGEAEGEQIVITPSKETENGGALCMSVSEALEGQAGLETRQVRAQTTPANIPVDWELLWLSVQHSAGAVTDYLSYTFAATIITDGVKWSNRINLTLLERFEGTAMLRVSLKSDPTILDYVTIKAPLPAPELNWDMRAEQTKTVETNENFDISVANVPQGTYKISVELDSPSSLSASVIQAATTTIYFKDGTSQNLINSGFYDERKEDSTSSIWVRTFTTFRLKLNRSDLDQISISCVKSLKAERIKMSYETNIPNSIEKIGTEAFANKGIMWNMQDKTWYGVSISARLRTAAQLIFSNMPAHYPFTIEVYYECASSYTGEFQISSTLRNEKSAHSITKQSTNRTGSFYLISHTNSADSESVSENNYLSVNLLPKYMENYIVPSGEVQFYVWFFYYPGSYDPYYVQDHFNMVK